MRCSLFLSKIWLVCVILSFMVIPQQTLADDSRSEIELLLQEFVLEALRDRQVVHPTNGEREAVTILLNMRPRPETLSQDEVAFLRSLKGDRIWTGAEERTVHRIWKEVTGKAWSQADN